MSKGMRWITMLAAWHAMAQTQIDLRTQTKSVDFSAATSTKPMKTGATLPATCTLGEVFFYTAAPPGASIYACTAANNWSAEAGTSTQNSSGNAGVLTVENSGMVVGSQGTINVIPGAGLTSIVTDTGSQINIQLGFDTAIVETGPEVQSGTSLLCASASSVTSAYQCTMSPTAIAYTAGMSLHWIPDVAGEGGPTTLNVDNLGAIPVKLADGITDPGVGSISGGQLYFIWYDGSHFRLPATALTGLNYVAENVANKGQPNGYASLDATGRIPNSQLPGSGTAASFELHLPLGMCAGPSSPVLLWSSPPPGATAATPGGCGGSNVNEAYALFSNSEISSLQFSVTLPQTLTGTADVHVSYLSSAAGGTFVPALDVVCTSINGTTADDPMFTANNFFVPGMVMTPATPNALQTVSAGGLDWPSGCTAGTQAHFRLIRSDTGGGAASVGIAEVVVVGMRSL